MVSISAAARASLISSTELGLATFAMIASRVRPGTSSRNSSSRLPAISVVWSDTPVAFPPGKARLVTRPVPIGSPAPANTIGMTDVACLTASTVPPGLNT